MNFKESIKNKLSEFLTLCKLHNVKNIYAFGSSVTNKFNPDSSDFDFLIEINTQDTIERGGSLMKLWDSFEIILQRKVDLITSNSIKNPILKKNIEATKVLIYDGENQKICI